jgi:hypothetical protein
MDNCPSDWPDSRPDLISRRRLLWLSGAGLAATVSGCALWDHPTPSSTPSPAASATPMAYPPPVPAAPPPTAAPSPYSGEMLCRAAWRAQPARAGGEPNLPMTNMTIHHTAVALGGSNGPARLRQHQLFHQDSHGWIDIAYHVGIDQQGNIFELRSPELVGNTATSYNPTGHFLVVCEGNFDEEPVTEEMLNSAALAFAWAAQQFHIPPETLKGHRDHSRDTACPGANLYEHVESGDLQRRVENMAAGKVDLRKVCGPDAEAKVAAIEAGG